MSKEQMLELLNSLAWADSSNYHHNNATRILREQYPGEGVDEWVQEFVKIRVAPPKPGSPK